jgi:hypothetical protein
MAIVWISQFVHNVYNTTKYVLEIQFMPKVNKRMVLTTVTISNSKKKGLIHEDQTYDQTCMSALC